MSEITAVVLSSGEKTLQHAIESIKRQTLPAQEIIIIENIKPFYRALNAGAAKVKTKFFVQVDADMVLDNNCFQKLRDCMAGNIGIVAGRLKDPLVGRCCCVKMFRRECFDVIQFTDSISPDTVFKTELLSHGWTTTHILNFNAKSKYLRHILGEHSPDYTEEYTYSKFLLLGSRSRYRKDLRELKWHLKKLTKNSHPASLIAQIAFCHGIFWEEQSDQLGLHSQNKDFHIFEKFSKTSSSYKIRFKARLFFSFSTRKLFKKYYKLGIALKKENAFPAFRFCFGTLNNNFDEFSWIAKVGLGHGIFTESFSEDIFAKEYKTLEEFCSEYTPIPVLANKFRGLIIGIYRRFHAVLGPAINKLSPIIFEQLDNELTPQTSSAKKAYE